ncbi:hypothetical protein NDU88_006226 [Pleurodeles waltl]|uniref:Uncharacterized protein n=1 Tax=Pleurodeles waltl TaxID=8319 RepID=A0AAV7NRB3_PLEWA|nr:hypothetical protein NDU88_006226 [Pleurodeles waltl]
MRIGPRAPHSSSGGSVTSTLPSGHPQAHRDRSPTSVYTPIRFWVFSGQCSGVRQTLLSQKQGQGKATPRPGKDRTQLRMSHFRRQLTRVSSSKRSHHQLQRPSLTPSQASISTHSSTVRSP